MGVDIRDLSPKAQKQALRKMQELQELRGGRKSVAGAILDGGEGKFTPNKKTAQRGSKYGNKKVEINGIQFDSKREAKRWLELDAMAKAGVIQNLRRQVWYELLPHQRIDGKLVEKAVSYVADFVYEQNGETVVEDSKGHRTKDYILKRKMMLFFHGIRIREV